MVAAGAFLKAVSGTISTAPGVRLMSRRAWSVLGTVRLGTPAEGSDSDPGAAWGAVMGCVWAGADRIGPACLTAGRASTVTLCRTAGGLAGANPGIQQC